MAAKAPETHLALVPHLKDGLLDRRACTHTLSTMLADVREDLIESRKYVQVAAVWAPGGGEGLRRLILCTLRSEKLKRQQNRVARLAYELKVLGAVRCVAGLDAPSFTECLEYLA
jgi:hypothetical protein